MLTLANATVVTIPISLSLPMIVRQPQAPHKTITSHFKMNIITPTRENESIVQQAAQLLVDAFREHWPDAWPTLEDALEEVHEMLESERICCVAVDEKGNLLGIIGGIPGYDGNVWELH